MAIKVLDVVATAINVLTVTRPTAIWFHWEPVECFVLMQLLRLGLLYLETLVGQSNRCDGGTNTLWPADLGFTAPKPGCGIQ